ncbi:MAG: peptide deformylase, partial [Lachnospiraceae bacterium]|nr:peptide deformylase [Lachnospiraceae bacterium]
MAIRNIREMGDEVLRKKSKEVKEMTPRLRSVVDDMLETLYQVDGVGLAGPQVGILKRIVVIDVSEERNQPLVLINPQILETSGSQTGMEGCLSVPGKHAQVTRANYVKVRA